MPITVELLCDEIDFLESTAQDVLEDNFSDGWYINANGGALLNVSKATDDQKKILLRRLRGYNPKLIKDKLIISLNEILKF
ncbi:MAG: hypothetical protein IJH63_02145 [Methanobrevibacter sp.]|nr:hypothetical protein [Methanobrevibacter sp.]